jgi:hypothetical protein
MLRFLWEGFKTGATIFTCIIIVFFAIAHYDNSKYLVMQQDIENGQVASYEKKFLDETTIKYKDRGLLFTREITVSNNRIDMNAWLNLLSHQDMALGIAGLISLFVSLVQFVSSVEERKKRKVQDNRPLPEKEIEE